MVMTTGMHHGDDYRGGRIMVMTRGMHHGDDYRLHRGVGSVRSGWNRVVTTLGIGAAGPPLSRDEPRSMLPAARLLAAMSKSVAARPSCEEREARPVRVRGSSVRQSVRCTRPRLSVSYTIQVSQAMHVQTDPTRPH